MDQPSCAQRESHLGNMAPEITGTNPIPLFVDPFCRANLMKHPPNETHDFYREFTHIWDHWFRSCFPYGPWEMGEKKKRWANLRLSKYSLPRCHVSLGLPYDFGDSNFLPRAQDGSGSIKHGKLGHPMDPAATPRSCEVRAVLWTYRTVQCWAGNLTLWNAARFFRCQKPDLKPQSRDGSESFPSNRGSSYCFHGGTLEIIQSSWMTMTLYWNLWWRLGIPWKPCLSARGSIVLQECQPLRVDPDAMLWEWVLFKHQKHIQKLEQSENSRNGCGYGSIPIHTIFSGMNIHLPAILMFTRGTRFWPTAMWRIPVHNFLISKPPK